MRSNTHVNSHTVSTINEQGTMYSHTVSTINEQGTVYSHTVSTINEQGTVYSHTVSTINEQGTVYRHTVSCSNSIHMHRTQSLHVPIQHYMCIHTHTHTHTTTTTIDSCQKWPRRSPKGGTVREVRGEVGSASNGAPGPVASETGVDYRLGNDVQSAGDQSL